MNHYLLKSKIIQQFLEYRGWEKRSHASKFIRFAPPSELGMNESYSLIVPTNEKAPDYKDFSRKITNIISEIYSISEVKLLTVFANESTILSFRLEDKKTADGSIHLKVLDQVLEKTRKTLLDVASATSLNSPFVEHRTIESSTYYENCKYLQTEHGSFVTNIELPTKIMLKENCLFTGKQLVAENINVRLSEYFTFVVDDVFGENNTIYSDQFFEDNQNFLSVQVLEDISELLKKTNCENVHFGFLSKSYQKDISATALTDDKHKLLSNYIKFVKEKIESDVKIDVQGKIVELRSRNPESDKNYIVVSSNFKDQAIILAMHLNNVDYQTAIQAHKNNREIKIKGFAKRMKTQYKITKLEKIE